MPHDINLITPLAAGLGLAFVLGYLAARGMVATARKLNPSIAVVLRTRNTEEAAMFA
jgi:predicted Kef-type K+ transport protein